MKKNYEKNHQNHQKRRFAVIRHQSFVIAFSSPVGCFRFSSASSVLSVGNLLAFIRHLSFSFRFLFQLIQFIQYFAKNIHYFG